MIEILTHPATSRYLLAAAFLTSGILHFLKPGVFLSIMPDYIPWHKAMVYISGAAEILGAVGILIPQTQFWAGCGLIALLIAVFPANIEMTVQALRHQGPESWWFWATVVRLPLQFVLIWWVYWACIQF